MIAAFTGYMVLDTFVIPHSYIVVEAEATEDADNENSAENAENAKNAENAENVENTENADDTENPENAENRPKRKKNGTGSGKPGRTRADDDNVSGELLGGAGHSGKRHGGREGRETNCDAMVFCHECTPMRESCDDCLFNLSPMRPGKCMQDNS